MIHLWIVEHGCGSVFSQGGVADGRFVVTGGLVVQVAPGAAQLLGVVSNQSSRRFSRHVVHLHTRVKNKF